MCIKSWDQCGLFWMLCHDDITTCKHFVHCWSFEMRIHHLLPNIWYHGGSKIGQIWGFRSLTAKVFIQFTSNLAFVLIGWVFKKYSIFYPLAKYLSPWWAMIGQMWGFWTLTGKNYSIHFKLCRCAYWVSVQKFLYFRLPAVSQTIKFKKHSSESLMFVTCSRQSVGTVPSLMPCFKWF